MAPGEIQSSVAAIVTAFGSFQDAFKSRLPLRKAGRGRGNQQSTRKIERLQTSLDEATHAIQGEYARGLIAHGTKFQRGDLEAQRALTSIALKLNSSLVSIISDLINNSSGGALLDYHELSILSDASKLQTCQSLSGLSRRLSQQPRLSKKPKTPQVGIRPRAVDQHQAQSAAKKPLKAKPSHERDKVSNEIRWAIVRTRPRYERKKSTSSTGSTGSSTLVESSLRSPKTPVAGNARLHTLEGSKEPRTSSKGGPSIELRGSHKASHLSVPENRLTPIQALPRPLNIPIDNPVTSKELNMKELLPIKPIARRRAQQATDSFYSFASDSTRIGEIPFDKLPTPFNFEVTKKQNESAGQASKESLISAPGKKRGFLNKILPRRNAIPTVAEL